MTNEQEKRQGPALPNQGCVTTAQERPDDWVCPQWKVSGIFSSHMVLQQGRPITVHGWCDHPGTPVTVRWGDECVTGSVSQDGTFALTLAPRPASFVPTEMTVFSHFGSDTFTDILVGDVWLIGGQSNAELNLEPCLPLTPDIEAVISGSDPFRLFTQTQAAAAAHSEYHRRPAPDIIEPEWCWQRPDPAAARRFSALGYYFARLIAGRVRVPLGLVMCCAGGACLRELMPADLAERLGYTAGANVPVCGYYNTLIAPLLGLQFRGQLFFQGESEGCWKETALSYDTDLADFVEDERRRFGVDFSFYNVQISSYREEGKQYFPYLEWVRSRQLRAVQLIPRSYLAVSRDLGSRPQDSDFAHSPRKYELARRVADLVLANDYGIGDSAAVNSPMPQAWQCEGDKVRVHFQWVCSGLKTADGGPVSGFAFPDENDAPVPAPAKITAPDTVEVTLPGGARPTQLYFAMQSQAGLDAANLLGGNGLPVPAFALPL